MWSTTSYALPFSRVLLNNGGGQRLPNLSPDVGVRLTQNDKENGKKWQHMNHTLWRQVCMR
jgi:hypothetical protein